MLTPASHYCFSPTLAQNVLAYHDSEVELTSLPLDTACDGSTLQWYHGACFTIKDADCLCACILRPLLVVWSTAKECWAHCLGPSITPGTRILLRTNSSPSHYPFRQVNSQLLVFMYAFRQNDNRPSCIDSTAPMLSSLSRGHWRSRYEPKLTLPPQRRAINRPSPE